MPSYCSCLCCSYSTEFTPSYYSYKLSTHTPGHSASLSTSEVTSHGSYSGQLYWQSMGSLEDDETAEGWADWHDHHNFVPFYDDPEFTLFSSKPLPGFQSASQFLHSNGVRDSSHPPDFNSDAQSEDLYGEQLSNNPGSPNRHFDAHSDEEEALYGEQLSNNPGRQNRHFNDSQNDEEEDLYGEQLSNNPGRQNDH